MITITFDGKYWVVNGFGRPVLTHPCLDYIVSVIGDLL